MSLKITFPTYLTLLRLFGAPIIMPLCIVHYLPFNNFLINLFIALLFLFFGFTDFLDGFFARRYGQVSTLGGALDHIADKFLVFSALVALLAVGRISYGWVLLLIGREFFMMSLREIALENRVKISVSHLGKLKTVFHIGLIAWIIINPAYANQTCFFQTIQLFLLAASVIISLVSAFDYVGKLYFQLKK